MTGLYIHIPFCAKKCAYCDFPSWPGREGDAGRYFSALLAEAALWRKELGALRFDTVFIGGGTPSLLPAGELERLMDGLRDVFSIEPVEFTIEANPGTVTREKLASFRRAGANRLSFGVQAAQDALLARLGRIHSWRQFVESLALAREAGFDNINADMMTGLPEQTTGDAEESARLLADMGLEHISCYGLILEEGTVLEAEVRRGDVSVPDDDAERDMFHRVKAMLLERGYERYEISNFSRQGRECVHNLNYWRNGDYLGLGVGAASHFSSRRRENHVELEEYIAALAAGSLPPGEEHAIAAEEAAFETLMLALRTTQGLDLAEFQRKHGNLLSIKWKNSVDRLAKQGLLYTMAGKLVLTEKGLDLQNTVLMEFMD